MTRWPMLIAVALVGIMVAAVSVQAQPDNGPPGGRRGDRVGPRPGGPGGPGGGFMLLRLENVQADLQLTAEQKTKLEALGQEPRGGRENRENREKQIAEILKPEQLERLKQIRIQIEPGMALHNNPEVAKALALTDEQKGKLRTLREEAREAMREAFQDGEDLTPQERRAKGVEMRKEMLEKALGVLTPEQREKFEKMQGAKIELDFSSLRPPRGGRGPAR